MHLRLIFLIVIIGLFAIGCGPHELPTAPTPIPTLIPATLPAGPVATVAAQSQSGGGVAIFNTNCSGCHNLTAETKVGPGLGPLFTLAKLPNGKPVNDDNLKQWIHTGGGAMPGFSSLTDDQLNQLLAYLKGATAGPAAAVTATSPTATTEITASVVTTPTVASQVAGQAALTGPGADLFKTNCAGCHNLTAERKVGPGLAKLFTLANLPNTKPINDDNVKQWIHTGGGQMPGFDSLSDDQLTQIVAFLREATK